jgi:hypothetical protein
MLLELLDALAEGRGAECHRASRAAKVERARSGVEARERFDGRQARHAAL